MNDIPEDEYDLGYLDAKISRLCTRIVEKDAEIERLKAALLRITRTGGDAVAIKFIHQIANEALEGKDG